MGKPKFDPKLFREALIAAREHRIAQYISAQGMGRTTAELKLAEISVLDEIISALHAAMK